MTGDLLLTVDFGANVSANVIQSAVRSLVYLNCFVFELHALQWNLNFFKGNLFIKMENFS